MLALRRWAAALSPQRHPWCPPRRHLWGRRQQQKQQLKQQQPSLFGEADTRGGYPSPYSDSLSRQDRLRLLRRSWLRLPETLAEIKDFYLYERVPFRPGDAHHGDYCFAANFPRDAGHDGWVVTPDSLYGEGFSTGQFAPTGSGSGLFSGRLSTRVPRNGHQYRAGYVNLRSPYRMVLGRPHAVSLAPMNCIVVRHRGDGRAYNLNLHRRNTPHYDNAYFDLYTYPLYTRGGPYWCVSKIPVSKLMRSYKGRIQNRPVLNDLTCHQHLSFTIADRRDGPFSLEIDYVAFYYDAHLNERFAYELYPVSSLMKLNLSHS